MAALVTVPLPVLTAQVWYGRGRLGQDGHLVRAAAGDVGREREAAVRGQDQAVARVVLQHDGAGEAGDRPADGVVVGGAGDHHVADVAARDAARSAVDGAGLPGRRRLGGHGDRVATAARHRGRERERPVREDGEVVAAVVPQHQARAGEAADGAADLVAVGRAGDRDAGDVGVGDRAGAGAAVDHAGLPGRRRLIGDRHLVGRAARQHRREGEAAARADREGRPAVERQLEAGAREPADGAADDVLVGAAVDGDRRDVGAADGAGRARQRARLRRVGRLGGDRDREASRR